MKILSPANWADRPLPTLDELALFCGGSAGTFTFELLRLMRRADPYNKRRLAQAYPDEYLALEIWQTMTAPTFGEMARWYKNAVEARDLAEVEK